MLDKLEVLEWEDMSPLVGKFDIVVVVHMLGLVEGWGMVEEETQ